MKVLNNYNRILFLTGGALYYYGICASSWHGIQEVRHYELFDYMKARWRALSDIYIFQKNKMTHKHLKANLAADFHVDIYVVG